ncbi:hypothetical protein [Paenibacillus sp. UNC499MF]|uniref:hypothetical protein n=1 Tax=Paenibacillus sp. UNC499MF TaxID=1502751 RepID=UPI0008A09A1E|nr:hypothetical protein [Paenibacillus sp. UNC499MF]SEG61296.1 hypothetical protein SAMN02799616_03777 [Paenibacillus sp. UNC499MF]
MKLLENVSEKKLANWLFIHTIIFFIGLLIVSYLGGDHDYISFRTGVIIAAVLYAPGLFLLIALYIRADRQTRKGYNLRLLLVLALVAAKYTFF